MASPGKKKGKLVTRRGMVTISSYCSPEELDALAMADAFTRYASYRPIISSKKSLVRAASGQDTNVTVAFTPDRLIVGFAVLQYPPLSERWVRVGHRIMMEVSVIEVARNWRSLGISTVILKYLVNNPLEADRIFYMVGYSWTWDLSGTGLSAIAYRNMMIKLFYSQNFKTFQTNEPNIMMRPENLFMARIGANISEQVKRRFKLVRFNMDG